MKKPCPEIEELIVDAKGAADMLGVHVDTFREYLRKGQISKPFRLGRKTVFLRSDIVEAVKNKLSPEAVAIAQYGNPL